MSTYGTADIRNVLLTGHGNSGKTTLADALLFAAGLIIPRECIGHCHRDQNMCSRWIGKCLAG